MRPESRESVGVWAHGTCRPIGEASRPRLRDATLAKIKGMTTKGFKQERTQSYLGMHGYCTAWGGQGWSSELLGKESPRLGAGLATRWGGGAGEACQAQSTFSARAAACLPGQGPQRGYRWSGWLGLSQISGQAEHMKGRGGVQGAGSVSQGLEAAT